MSRRRGKFTRAEWREMRESIQATQQPTKKPRGPLCFGYRRCSHEDLVESQLSLEEQTQSIEQWFQTITADYRNLQWGEMFTDKVEVANENFLNRPGGRDLNAALRPGDHVIFAKLDRGFRNTKDCLAMLKSWTRRGIIVHFADLRVDLSSARGNFMITTVAACARLQASVTSERNKAVMRRLKAEGRPVNGQMPYGFRWSCVDRRQRRLVPDHKIRRIGQEIVRVHDDCGWKWDAILKHVLRYVGNGQKRKTRNYFLRPKKWTEARCRGVYFAEKELRAKEQAKAEKREASTTEV